MNLVDFLHQIKFDPRYQNEVDQIWISFIHRGTCSNEKSVPYTAIKQIYGKYLILNDKSDEDVHIPLHRVTRVENIKTDKIYYVHNK
jgi:uncharacterized protein (UPF0248 family)